MSDILQRFTISSILKGKSLSSFLEAFATLLLLIFRPERPVEQLLMKPRTAAAMSK